MGKQAPPQGDRVGASCRQPRTGAGFPEFFPLIFWKPTEAKEIGNRKVGYGKESSGGINRPTMEFTRVVNSDRNPKGMMPQRKV